ncbi:MAG: hypothetical protein A3I72_01930 [Candidatus Tectomicrobia bacterium RIFCSPLOWO2_02_FULL_70_19]|nr:MAG: hypothetical protein A3I72_01930 [Candidatus Tectomicrobia bacterium RIFCSPLOWO2_02_FULL_70_19]
MILKMVILVVLALYLSVQGHWPLAVLALAALWPTVGLGIAIVLTILLALASEAWPAAILGILIIGNLVGNYYLQHRRESDEATK